MDHLATILILSFCILPIFGRTIHSLSEEGPLAGIDHQLDSLNAMGTIYAEGYNYQADARIVYTCEEYNETVTLTDMTVNVIGPTTALGYSNVNFDTGVYAVEVSFGADYVIGEDSQMTMHLDSPTAVPFVALDLTDTGGWTTFDTIQKNVSSVPNGVHDLYLTFASDYTSGRICYLNWFTFTPL